ncbi:hypothetical protein FRX31_012704 [Thalictrum thalictroides]|uniref:F-box associated beta-propeller type 3 domain-containing protein n=1 Tax=Thalictrum thalictroides TaxID=46969 RepID=A0A7J6WNM0_THATH|nr:hypothetical protein FRX31_012704 [Thalictrum thalictroides]
MIQHPFFSNKTRSKAPFKWAIHDCDKSILIVTAEQNGSTKTEEIEYPDTMWDFRYCNGIIGFYSIEKGSYNLCLSNITTVESIELEPPTDESTDGGHFELAFDSSSKKHKVLVWRECEDSKYYPSECYVRTLEEGTSWRPVSNVPQALRRRQHPHHERPQFCCANGALFWFIGKEHIMVSFNVAREQFRTVKLPQKLSNMVNEKEFRYSIFEFEGYLCLVEQPSSAHNKFNLEIGNLWMLKDIENNVWVTMLNNKMLPLEGTNLRNYFLEEDFPFDAIFLSQNGEILIAATDEEQKYIFSYSFLSGQFKRIEIFGELGGIHHFRVNNYVENYLSLEDFGWVF